MRSGDAAKSIRVDAILAGHGRNGVPGQMGEVKDLPLDLPSAFVEGEYEEPWVP